MGKLVRVALAVLTVQLLIAGVAQAQDFGTLVVQAVAANQQLVNQIKVAAQANDLAALRAGIAEGVSSAQAAQSLLQEALALAPDDAARSRIQGGLIHVHDSLSSAIQATERTSLDAARSSLDAARGEAVEAFNELAPFATALVPATLPATGGAPVALLAGCGLGVLMLGLGIRRPMGPKISQS